MDKKVLELCLAAAQMEEGTDKNAAYVTELAEALSSRLAAWHDYAELVTEIAGGALKDITWRQDILDNLSEMDKGGK